MGKIYRKSGSFCIIISFFYYSTECHFTNKGVFIVLIKGLVFAGIADLARPADKLSPSQSTALAATGECS